MSRVAAKNIMGGLLRLSVVLLLGLSCLTIVPAWLAKAGRHRLRASLAYSADGGDVVLRLVNAGRSNLRLPLENLNCFIRPSPGRDFATFYVFPESRSGRPGSAGPNLTLLRPGEAAEIKGIRRLLEDLPDRPLRMGAAYAHPGSPEDGDDVWRGWSRSFALELFRPEAE